MKKKIIIFALTTLFVACTPVEYDHFSTITGMVIDDEDRSPIMGADITLSPKIRKTESDIDGYFRFVDLEPDNYTIQVQKDGYDFQRKPVPLVAGETKNMIFYMKKKQQKQY